MSSIIVSAAVCQAANRVIGSNGKIPWQGKLKGEQDLFKTVTAGKAVVMGRKTWESIPTKYKPLPARLNLVLTSEEWCWSQVKEFSKVNVNSVAEAIKMAEYCNYPEVVFIGGQRVYEESMPLWDKLYRTTLKKEFKGDTFFPEIAMEDDWYTSHQIGFPEGEGRICSFTFEIFDKKKAQS